MTSLLTPDIRSELLKEQAQKVLEAAWNTGHNFEALTVDTMRTISMDLAGYAFRRQHFPWVPEMEALRLAWNDYCTLSPDADRLDAECGRLLDDTNEERMLTEAETLGERSF